jgi:transcriptional regulator with XRE-family HTH domain
LDRPIKLHTERLRLLREQRGWSQRELARLCGFGETQIRKYEAGMVDPSATNLGIIAALFDVSADYLLGRTDSRQVHITETELNLEETELISLYRREGWSGVARLSVERLSKS